jgi:hypothetical protein
VVALQSLTAQHPDHGLGGNFRSRRVEIEQRRGGDIEHAA